MTDDPLAVLRNSGSIPILMFLQENDGCLKTRVYDHVSHNHTIARRMEELASSGLIEIASGERSTRLYLTPEGREVAVRLDEIRRIIEGAAERHPVPRRRPRPSSFQYPTRCYDSSVRSSVPSPAMRCRPSTTARTPRRVVRTVPIHPVISDQSVL